MKLSYHNPNSALTPELKEFLDRVVVPNLVRDFLKSHPQPNVLAEAPDDGVESVRFQTVPAEVLR